MDQFCQWFGMVLRQARRDGDMSQRELAAWSEIPKSVIADIETGNVNASLRVARELLVVLGYRVSICNRRGEEVDELFYDERRDRRDRRFPPHLDVRELSPVELTWRLWTEYRPRPLTPHTYKLDRDARDLDRYFGWYGEGPHNWLPPDPDRDYVRSVLGGDPPEPRWPPVPPPEDWLAPGMSVDHTVFIPAGSRRPRSPFRY